MFVFLLYGICSGMNCSMKREKIQAPCYHSSHLKDFKSVRRENMMSYNSPISRLLMRARRLASIGPCSVLPPLAPICVAGGPIGLCLAYSDEPKVFNTHLISTSPICLGSGWRED